VAPAAGSALFQNFCRSFFSSYCSLTVEGQDRVPKPPFIICSNHSSHADSAILMTASRLPFREFALLGASDYFFASWSVRLRVAAFMNVIPIDRRPSAGSLATSLTMCRDFLWQRKGNLIIYPEGTRSKNGRMQRFKTGAGLFALELGAPIVPAYIDGAYYILPKGKSLPRIGVVTVRFGEPVFIDSEVPNDLSPRQRRKMATEVLEERVLDLREILVSSSNDKTLAAAAR